MRHLAPAADVIGLSRHALRQPDGASAHVACDLLDAQQVLRVVAELRPALVIHAQALSDVDRCEREPQAAQAHNVDALRHVVRALAPSRALLIAVSTDYVFDGAKAAPYDERDEPHPISVYGRSKHAAERCALERERAVIVRTSTLFGAGRMNYCDHIVQQLRDGQPVEAFLDQVTSPTFTDDLAESLVELSQALEARWGAEIPRVYHLANRGGCSRVAFAERIADLLGCRRDLIRQISMAAQRRPAPRPAYSALMTVNVPQLIGRSLRPWDDALQAYLRQRHWLN